MSHGLVVSDNSLGPSDHTFGLPDHDLEPQGRYRSHGPRLVRVVANDHYKYVRQARERYHMPMTFISILLACLPFNAHMQRAFSARIQSIVRNRGGWNIMHGAAPHIRALGRTLERVLIHPDILGIASGLELQRLLRQWGLKTLSFKPWDDGQVRLSPGTFALQERSCHGIPRHLRDLVVVNLHCVEETM